MADELTGWLADCLWSIWHPIQKFECVSGFVVVVAYSKAARITRLGLKYSFKNAHTFDLTISKSNM